MSKFTSFIRVLVTHGFVALSVVCATSLAGAADRRGNIGSHTVHKGTAASICTADTEAPEAVSASPAFVVLKMGRGTNGWFNAGEVMSFYPAPGGITVPCAQTEITVHGNRYWVQQKPEEVARLLAKARGTAELEGFVILTMGGGRPGWFNATETMAFYPAVPGISVGVVRTEIVVHDFSHWVQETADQVAQKLAEALAKTVSTP